MFMVVASTGLYQYWGSYQAWQASIEMQDDRVRYQSLFNRFVNQPFGLEQLNQAVQEELKLRPNSVQGWFVLGKIALVQGNMDASIDSFNRAYQLEPRDPDILSAYIQALYQREKQVTPQIRTLIDTLLVLQPNHESALNMLAQDAFEKGQYAQAIDNWEIILSHYDSNSEMAKALAAAIATARDRTQDKKN